MSGSVVQDDEEGHLMFKLGDVIQSRHVKFYREIFSTIVILLQVQNNIRAR